MKTTKRRILSIVICSVLLCIFACITVYALELNDSTISYSSSGEEELMPLAANGCIKYPSKFVGTPGSSTEEYNEKGEKYIIRFGPDGYAQYYIHYSDHGSPGYHAIPHYHTFEVLNGFWTPTGNYPGLPD